MTKNEIHYQKMNNTPIPKLIMSLAVPTIITMLISNVYNLVDTYFVGSLGVSESGATGIVFTLMSLIQALGFMLGQGAGSIISRRLADKDVSNANNYFNTAFFTSIAIGLIFTLVGLLTITPLMRLLGSTETILPYAEIYSTYILIGAPALMASLVLNNIMRYEGMAFYAMIGLSTGAIINMIGDPILIYGLHMGMHGAGLSTAISQYVSFIILVILFAKKSQMKFNFKMINLKSKTLWEITKVGFPSFLRQGLSSVSIGILNNVAKLFGDACVSAMSIVSRCQGFMMSISLGIGQGFQPVSGFSYQRKQYLRLRKAFYFTLFASVLVMVVFAIFGSIFAKEIVALFINSTATDADRVIEIGTVALRFTCVGLVMLPFSITPNMLFQSTGLSLKATFIALLRTGIYFIPLAIFMPKIFGLIGIQSAQAVSDILSSLTSIPFFILFFKKLPKTDMEDIS